MVELSAGLAGCTDCAVRHTTIPSDTASAVTAEVSWGLDVTTEDE